MAGAPPGRGVRGAVPTALVRNYLTQRDEPPTVTSQKKSSTEKRVKDTVFYVPLQKCTAKW